MLRSLQHGSEEREVEQADHVSRLLVSMITQHHHPCPEACGLSSVLADNLGLIGIIWAPLDDCK